jgi:hypothetical protein
MARFVTTKAALSHLEQIIDSAERELVLLSPYVHLAPDLRDRLRHADARGVRITFIYGKKELHEEVRQEFARYQHMTLYFSERLHAKCYFNEHKMVITSLNLIEKSEHNFEMGVVLERDEEIYVEARREVELIKSQAEIRLAPGTRPAGMPTPIQVSAPKRAAKTSGFCIRCSQKIELDPDRPLCATCFASWARFENWEFAEKVCHRCGRPGATSRLKPQCYQCFKAAASRS